MNINENDQQTFDRFATFDELLARCHTELDALSRILSDVRSRQKAQFGELLIRTTLNKPFKDLIEESKQLEGS